MILFIGSRYIRIYDISKIILKSSILVQYHYPELQNTLSRMVSCIAFKFEVAKIYRNLFYNTTMQYNNESKFYTGPLSILNVNN